MVANILLVESISYPPKKPIIRKPINAAGVEAREPTILYGILPNTVK